MPDESVHLGQLHQLFGPVVSDQGQIYSFGNLREHCEVRPGAVVRGTERIRTARPFLHLTTVATPTAGRGMVGGFEPESSSAQSDPAGTLRSYPVPGSRDRPVTRNIPRL
jgi:hypothetical protein